MNTYKSAGAIAPIVGGAALLVGSLSVLSLMAGGAAILNTPSNPVVDALVSGAIAGTGLLIIRDGRWLAATLGAVCIGLMLGFTGLDFSGKQALNMGKAVATGVKTAAQAGAATASATASGQPSGDVHAGFVRGARLNATQLNDCKSPTPPAWASSPAGIRNCTPDSAGHYYIWKPAS